MASAFSKLSRHLLHRTLVQHRIIHQLNGWRVLLFFFGYWILSLPSNAQIKELDACNISWDTQSRNSAESMPCGGGDIGLNVWVENGDILLYLSQSGMFDENNALLKAGRVRVRLSPNPFAGKTFKQELILRDGYIKINGSDGKLSADINVWVDVFHPAIHLDVKATRPVKTTVAYESWRYTDRPSTTKENKANSWKWANTRVITQKDVTGFNGNRILFYHRNLDSTVFDVTVKHEELDSVKHLLYNPLKNLCFGGSLQAPAMQPAGTYQGRYLDTDFEGWRLESRKPVVSNSISIVLHTSQATSTEQWQHELDLIMREALSDTPDAWQKTKTWWNQFWNRSFVFINSERAEPSSAIWQTGRNYQLFRYMLGCNAFGKYPSKFNGGLFTYDPVFTDSSLHGTPDHRNWGGGTFTAQNQRLVYWPMLKSGDIDMMQPQFNFYAQLLKNAELRTLSYWKHKGASFTEQLENFGLPNMAEYGLKRPVELDKGVEYNDWLEYEWDTVLEFCMMILESEKYETVNISRYIPLIESCLVFFDEHYQFLARQRGSKPLDGAGKLVLFPGSAAETFKMAYNATSTIAALETVTKSLLRSQYLTEERKKYFTNFQAKIPPISFRSFNGHTTIAPAKVWARVNNVESPQLYPVFPWGIYGIGKPGIDTAINTWLYDTLAVKFRSALGWKQDNIFAARLGLTDDAARLTVLKLQNSERRFPSFWGPGFDWTPDLNHGGSGMIGLQEMLLQTDDKKIFLFPAWKKEWNVHFKLHAPYNTTVEASLVDGKLENLEVLPKERAKDVVNMMLPGKH